MIKINECTIELNVDSTHYLVTDRNKMIGFKEHKGETIGGEPILFYEKENKVLTPKEILYYFGTYQVIYL